jgi:hypothetical protein
MLQGHWLHGLPALALLLAGHGSDTRQCANRAFKHYQGCARVAMRDVARRTRALGQCERAYTRARERCHAAPREREQARRER